MFPRIEYLTWYTGRPEAARFNFATSGLKPLAPDPEPTLHSWSTEALNSSDERPLNELIAAEFGVPSKSVLVTSGATHANLLAAATVIDESDQPEPNVLVESPTYEPLVATAKGFGAHITHFDRHSEDDYQVTSEQVTNAMTPETELVVISNRHNPSGVLSDRDTLASVAASVAEEEAWLHVDEVFAPFVLEERAGKTAFGGVTAAGLPNTVVTGSLTKFHGLDSIRIGWMIGDEQIIDRAREISRHFALVADHSVTLARQALQDEQLVATARTHLRKNHASFSSFVENRDDLVGTVPTGSTHAFLAHRDVDGDRLAEHLSDDGILVVPGRFFGDSERVRICIAQKPKRMREGLELFGDSLNRLEARNESKR